MVKVRATQRGHFKHVREVGDEFEVPDDLKGSWFVPVEAPLVVTASQPVPVERVAPRRGRPPKT